MPKTKPSPNDQRSQTKNPNHPSYAADVANRQKLGHSGVPPLPDAHVPADPPPKK